MKKRRFLASNDIQDAREIILKDAEARHLLTVLRLGPDDVIEVIDGRGNLVEACITSIDSKKNKVLVTPISPIYFKDDRLPIVLVVAPVKAEKMASIVRQATECGVHTILPILTQRTVVRPGNTKVERLREIALQSLKQCGGLYAPDILPPTPINEIQKALGQVELKSTTRFLLSPGKTASPLVRLALQTRPPWTVVVGPEGGLTDHEIEFLKEIGFLEANLGPRILRTETASTVTIGILSNCQEIVVNGVRHHEISVFEF